MTNPSPLVLINSQSQLPNGVDVLDGSTVTIALASAQGVYAWNVECIGTDDGNTTAAVNATLVVNAANFTATFTAPTSPDGYGCALIFKSVVNNGFDINGLSQAYLTTTFGVYVPAFVNGVRLGAQNETIEGNAVYGWLSKLNQAIRAGLFTGGFLTGDVNGPVPDNQIDFLQGNPLLVSGAITTNNVLTWNGSAWVPLAAQGGILAGDTTGPFDSNTVVAIQNHSVAAPVTTGNVLQVGPGPTIDWAAINLAGGSNFVTGILPNTNQQSQVVGLDLSGTTDAATVIALQGYAVSTNAPPDGYVLTWSATNNQWEPVNVGTGSSILAGDVTGLNSANSVVRIQGRNVASTAPNNLDILAWHSGSSDWEPTPASDIPFVTWADDLVTSSNTHQYVTNLYGRNDGFANSAVTGFQVCTVGRSPFNSTFYLLHDAPDAAPGDFIIQGAFRKQAGGYDAGNVIIRGGDSSLRGTAADRVAGSVTVIGGTVSGNVHISGGDGYIGALNGGLVDFNIGKPASGASGEGYFNFNAQNSAGSKTVIASFGSGTYGVTINPKAFGASTAPITIASGTSGSTLTSDGVFAVTGNGVTINSASSNTTITSAVGNVVLYGNGGVVRIGNSTYGIFGPNGITFDNNITTTSSGTAINIGGAGNYAGGHLDIQAQGAGGGVGVNKGGTLYLRGGWSTGNASDGDVIIAGGTSTPIPRVTVTSSNVTLASLAGSGAGYVAVDNIGQLSFTASAAPGGAAGGDLSGSYPNPTVAKINGVSVSASPTADQVLVTISGVASVWQKITNNQISATAAIDGSKIVPNFGLQTLTAGTTNVGALTAGTSVLGSTTSVNSIAGSLTFTTKTFSTTGTVDTTTKDLLIYADTSGGAFTLTLPAPTNGRILVIKDKKQTFFTNNLTLARNASEKIDGITASLVLSIDNQEIILTSDGTDWYTQGTGGATGVAGGDLSGFYPNPNVVKLRGKDLHSSLSSIGISDDGYVLTWDGVDGYWHALPTAAAGVATIGTIDSQTKSSDGLVIIGTVLYAQTADASFPGMVSTGTQTFAGNKTLSGSTTLSALSTGVVHADSGGALTSSLIVNADVDTAAAIDGTKISPAFGSQNISTSGNLTISSLSTGIVHSDSGGLFSSSTIVNADVSSSAAIDVSKLAAGTAAQLLLNNATPTPTWTTMSGDATISSSGVITNIGIRGKTLDSTLASIGSIQDGYVLTWDNTNSAWFAKSPATLIADGQNFAFSNTSSDISGYDNLYDVATGSEGDLTAVCNNNTVLIKAFGTVANIPNVQVIPAGMWEFNFYAYASLTGAFTTNVIFDVYTRTAGGTETLLFSATSANIQVTSVGFYTLLYNFTTDTYIATDTRVVIKVSGKTTNVVDTTVHFVFDGTTHASIVRTPIAGDALQLGGDVTGTTSVNTVVKINGTSVPASPSADQVLVATSGTAAVWQKIVNAQIDSAAAIDYNKLTLSNSIVNADVSSSAAIAVDKLAVGTAAQILMNNATPTPTWTSISGDITLGNTGVITVVALQGTAIDATPPTTNQVLQYNGSVWIPTSFGGSGVTWADDLSSSSNTHQWVSGISGSSGTSGTVTLGDGTNALTLLGVAVTSYAQGPDVTIQGSAGGTQAASSGKQGGIVTIAGGTGGAGQGGNNDGGGGHLDLNGGSGGPGTGGTGGSVNITGGSTAGGDAGNVNISGGVHTLTGNHGVITLKTASTTRLTVGATGTITVAAFGTGLVHSDSSGNLTSSTLVDADVNASAAIAGSKITPNFGSQALTAGTSVLGTTTSANSIIGSLTYTTKTFSSTGTVDTSTNDLLIYADTSGSGFTLTLPPPTNGRTLIVKDKKQSFNSNNLTIAPNGSEKIDGVAASVVLNITNEQIILTSDGTDWFTNIAGSSPIGTAGGDLSGIYPNPTVVKWYSVPLDSSIGAPSDAQITAYDSSSSKWKAASISGDISMTHDGVVTVTKIQNLTVHSGASDAQVLIYNGGTPEWHAQTLSQDAITSNTGAITVQGVHTRTIHDSTPNDGDVLTWDNGNSYWKYAAQTGGPPSGSAGGDLSGTYPNPTVAKVNGVAYPASPSTNTVPVITSANTITYQQIADAQVNSSAAIAVSKLAAGTSAQILLNTSTPTPTWTTVSGDATISSTGVVNVTDITGASGKVDISSSGNIITWAAATTAPGVAQTSTSSGSGADMTIAAQGATGASNNGGNLVLSAGTSGSATAGVINLNGSIRQVVSGAKTSNYTMVRGDNIVLVGTLSSSITITLPASPATGDSYKIKTGSTCYQFMRNDAGTLTTVGYTVTVTPSSGNIDGQTSHILSTPYAALSVVYTGSEWSIV